MASSHAGEPSRAAKFEDISGVKTDVTELECSFKGSSRFSDLDDCIGIATAGYEIAIPASRLISIKCAGDKAEVTYDWLGQQRTISGILDAKFSGKSDFGEFELASEKLRHLGFADKPVAEKKEPYGTPCPASVSLKSGAIIRFSDLKRHASYYSTEGYIMGGSTRYLHYCNFKFMRGESLATSEFAAIRKLEFNADDNVIVSLKNGNTGSGKLSSKDDARVDGWTGETEQGFVFLPPALVQSIEFGDSGTTVTKSK